MMDVINEMEFGMRDNSFRKMRLVISVLTLILISACNGKVVNQVINTAVAQPSEAPTSTTEILPTEVSASTARVLPTESVAASENVTIYLVALEDGGQSGKKIGCDDSLVPVILTSNSTEAPPWNALEALLNLKETYFGESGLYNALYQSNLSLQSYEVDNGKVQVYLEGEMILGGVCDNPRAEEQILGTINQEGLFDDVGVYVNGVVLEDVLSLK